MADVKQQTTKTTTAEDGHGRRQLVRHLRGVRRAARREAALLRELRRTPARQGWSGHPVLRERRQARSPGGPGRRHGPSGARAAAVLFFVVLPIAVAIGVLVGKGNGNDNQDIADAIKNLQAGGAGSQLASTAASTPITSDWTLDKGYTVELKTLPQSSDQAAVDAAKKAATSQGAPDVGVINPADFTVTPAPQGGGYVLYSGQFKTKAEATKALAKLKGKFLGRPGRGGEEERRGRPGAARRQDGLRRRPQGRGLHAERPEGRVGHGDRQPAGPEDRQELRRLAEGPARRDRRRR